MEDCYIWLIFSKSDNLVLPNITVVCPFCPFYPFCPKVRADRNRTGLVLSKLFKDSTLRKNGTTEQMKNKIEDITLCL